MQQRVAEIVAMDPDLEPDMVLITFYVTDDLSPEERRDFEARMRTDAAFRELAEPIIGAWSTPGTRAGDGFVAPGEAP